MELKQNEEELDKLSKEGDGQDLIELSTRCSDIKAILHERQTKLQPCKFLQGVANPFASKEVVSLFCSVVLEFLKHNNVMFADIDTMRQFSEEVTGLTAWLQDVESFLQSEQQLPVGDLETLEAQLEQSNVCSMLDLILI